MRIISVMCIVMAYMGGINNAIAFQGNQSFSDTSYIKKVTYTRLNNLVSYHIISKGRTAGKSDVVYSIKQIATYYYSNHNYEKEKKDTQTYEKSTDVTKLIFSDIFSNKVGFDGIFKVNSKAMFAYKPWILKKMTVAPKSQDTVSLHKLISKLKKEHFVSEALLKSSNLQWIGGVRKSIYITIVLNPSYRNVESGKAIKKQLKKWPEISDASSSADFFTGNSEYETIFRITSKEK